VINVSHMTPKELGDAKQECTLLSQLTHPNIVEYREHFVANGELCIVMAFAEGGDLYSKIQSQRGRLFSEDEVCNYFVQILLAMKHVHARRILHRDLKSQNIFLTGGQKLIKLGDFGIAKVLQNSMACARTAIGTPYARGNPSLCARFRFLEVSDLGSFRASRSRSVHSLVALVEHSCDCAPLAW
jgi:NIMA (never in mitosis gene a)-related kinase